MAKKRKVTFAEIAKIIKGKEIKGDKSYWGVVQSKNTDGTMNVNLGGDTGTTKCRRLANANVGDTVFVTLRTTGEAIVTGTKDGDVDIANSVGKVTVYYALSSSPTVTPQSGWSTTAPERIPGTYMWQKTVTEKNSGSTTETVTCIQGADGHDGQDGKVIYCTSGSSESTTAKDAYIQSGTWPGLVAGVTISVKFTYGNTASSPRLDIYANGSWTGYYYIRTNGINSAYWQAGQTVLLTFDGSYWNATSAPVYASTATIGNPVSKNVVLDDTSIKFKNSNNLLAEFAADSIYLSKNSKESTIDMMNGGMFIKGIGGDGPDDSYSLEIGSDLTTAQCETKHINLNAGFYEDTMFDQSTCWSEINMKGMSLGTGNAYVSLEAVNPENGLSARKSEASIRISSDGEITLETYQDNDKGIYGTTIFDSDVNFRSGNIYGLNKGLVTSSHSYTTTVASGATENFTKTISKSGYYPLGVVGHAMTNGSGSGTSYSRIWGVRSTSSSSGSCEIQYNVRADGGKVNGCTFVIHILWAKLY